MQKPGQVQAIAIYTLVVGIINILTGIGWGISLIGLPVGIYCIVLGILEILYATKIMATPIKVDKPAKYIAIMEIVNVISFNLVSVAAGIVSLVFYNDEKVKAYFAGAGAPSTVTNAPPPPPPPPQV